MESDLSCCNKRPHDSLSEKQVVSESAQEKKLCTDHNQVSISDINIDDIPTTTAIKKENGKVFFNGVELSQLTKRQTKKFLKILKWESRKKEKRAKEREKAKERKVEAKKNNLDLGPSRKELKRSKMKNSSCKISVAFDLSFDDLMISKDMGKVIKQLLRVYTENRRSKSSMQLHLTNFEGRVKEEMERHHGYENWDMNFHTESYLDIFPKERLVYLTSESDNVIESLEDDKVYIIGGLVDHNSHKGVCFEKAKKEGIAHGQLPIAEYFNIKSRKVFTINQVFEILLRVSEGKTFKEAFELILPKRINIKSKSDEESDGNETDKD